MKYCPNCGTQLPDDAAFCQNCGKALAEQAAPQPQPQPQEQAPQYQQPAPQYQPPQYQPPQYQQAPAPAQGAPAGAKGKAIASMVLGIIATVFCWFGWFSIVALAMAVVGIVLAVMARNAIPVGGEGRGMATAGLVLGIVGAALSGIALVCWICVAAAVNDIASSTYWYY